MFQRKPNLNQFQAPPQVNQFQAPTNQFQQQQFIPPPGNYIQQPPPQMPMYGMYEQPPANTNTNKYAPDVSDWGE